MKKVIFIAVLFISLFMINNVSAINFEEEIPVFKIANTKYNENVITIDNTIDADYFVIYVATSKKGKYKVLAKTNETEYKHLKLTTGKTYYYKIRAVKNGEEKEIYSKTSQIKGIKVIPEKPTIENTKLSYNYATTTWNKVSGATGYEVYRSTNGKKYTKVKTLKTTSYKNTGLNVGTRYYYKVRTYRTVKGKKIYSKYSNVINVRPYLKANTVKGISKYYGYAKVEFSKVSGASGYNVYRADSADGKYSYVGKTTKLYYNDKSAKKGVTYYYKVRAYRKIKGKNKNGSYSNIVSTSRLSNTINFSITANSYNSNKLEITKDKYATKYYIYRATSKKGKYKKIATLYSKDYENIVTYIDKKLTYNKTYYYKISMSYKDTSSYSSIKYLKTQLIVPQIEINSNIINILNRESNVKYEVYVSKDNNNFEYLDTTSSSYTIPDEYLNISNVTYKVRSYIKIGNKKYYSKYSNIVTVTVSGPVTSSDGCFVAENGEIITYSCENENVVIPSEISGMTITSIGNSIFYQKNIKTLEIPDSVEKIGTLAFAHNNITTLKLSKNLKEIGDSAFSGNAIEALEIPDSVEKIGALAFEENNIVTLKLPNSLKEIPANAFIHNQIETLEIPDSVEIIGRAAFDYNKIKTLKLSNNLKEIAEYAFSGLYEYDEDLNEFVYSGNQIKNLEIPDSVEKIGASAFSMNNITTLKLSNNLKEIDSSAFKQNALETLEIPDSVEKIGDNAFSLNKIKTLKLPNNLKEIYENVFHDNQIETLEIPDSVEKIGNYAFDSNKIKTLKLPKSLKEIGKEAFYDNAIVSLEIPDGVERIKERAFRENDITSLKLSQNLKEIGAEAFYDNAIESLEVPDSVETIGALAFYQNNIVTLKLPNSLKEIENGTFSYNAIESLDIPDSVEKIGNEAFYSNKIKTLKLSSNLKEIGEEAFSGTCEYDDNLEDFVLGNQINILEIPDYVEKIGSRAFSENNIKTLKLSNNLKEIGEEAFYDNAIETLEIPSTVEKIGSSAFDSNRLSSVRIINKDSSEEFGLYGETLFGWKSNVTCVKDNTSNVENGCIIWGVN